MAPRKTFTIFPSLAVMIAALAVVGCDSRTTGVTQLPVPPNREQTAFTSAPPANGPPPVTSSECRTGRGAYRLGAGDKIRVIVLQDSEFSGDYEVNATGAISVRVRTGSTTISSRMS